MDHLIDVNYLKGNSTLERRNSPSEMFDTGGILTCEEVKAALCVWSRKSGMERYKVRGKEGTRWTWQDLGGLVSGVICIKRFTVSAV